MPCRTRLFPRADEACPLLSTWHLQDSPCEGCSTLLRDTWGAIFLPETRNTSLSQDIIQCLGSDRTSQNKRTDGQLTLWRESLPQRPCIPVLRLEQVEDMCSASVLKSMDDSRERRSVSSGVSFETIIAPDQRLGWHFQNIWRICPEFYYKGVWGLGFGVWGLGFGRAS